MNEFSLDQLQKIRAGLEPLQEVIPVGKKGVDNSCEIARGCGAERAIKAADALEQGTNEFFKTFEEFNQSAKDVEVYYTKLNSAVNF
ncbi:hypothetical protein UT300012_23290 [Paraclostridium bifermentans]